MTSRTCRCGKPTRDSLHFCDDCAHSLSVALGEIPWLEEELDISITRQQGVDYRTKGSVRASERPSPVVWTVSEARGHLKATLVSWTRYSLDEKVRNSSPHQAAPEDTLTALSRFLMWRVDGLALLDIGPEAVDEITDAVATCHRLIDTPPSRQYLGDCDACPDGRLYARQGSTWARCNSCDAATNADDLRTQLLADLDDRLLTAAEIANLSRHFNLRADREVVRKRINKWHERRVIESETMLDEPAFRFGIVWRLLIADDQRQAS